MLIRLSLWAGLAALLLWPVVIATQSPFLIGRDGVYIIAGLAGIAALSLMALQPILAMSFLPGPRRYTQRRWHLWSGRALILAIILHVGGLYLTSPPDALDALLLRSPTPFSVYGVLAMWGLIITAILVVMRRRAPPYRWWRLAHTALACIIVGTSIAHVWLIDGTMHPLSKIVICLFAAGVTVFAITRRARKQSKFSV